MKKISVENKIYSTIWYIIIVIFLIVIGISLIFKSSYSNNQLVFSSLSIYDIITLFLNSFIWILIIKYKKVVEDYIRYKWMLLIYSFFAVLFIYFVPLKPSFPYDEYIQMTSGIIIKLGNVVTLLGISLLSGNIVKNLKWEFPKLTSLLILLFLPLCFYMNHIGFDFITLFLILSAIYLYTKKGKYIACSLFTLVIASLYSVSAVIIFTAVIIDFFIHNNMKKKVLKEKLKKVGIPMIVSIIVMVEFQNIDVERYIPASPKDRNIMMWSEGVYESNIYGFGNDYENYKDKFEYLTIATPYLMISSQESRLFISSFCRSQSIIFLFGMVMAIYFSKRKNKTFLLFTLIIVIGMVTTFCFKISLNSIIQYYPFIIMMAVQYYTKLKIIKRDDYA